MTGRTVLEQLCERYHIAAEYQDIWGQRHVASEQTRRALLLAMGIPTNSEQDMQLALAQSESTAWRRCLAAVQVMREDEDAIPIQIGVDVRQAGQRWRWLLVQENGQRLSAEFVPADLPLHGQKVLEGETWQQCLLVLPGIPNTGYHRLELHYLGQPELPLSTMSLVVAPRRCYQPEVIKQGGRVWGPAIQLYALRSARNWGIGDFTDLLRLLEFCAAAGADLLGLNPLHALFPHNPAHASPYSPSSRRFLNVLYLDVTVIADFAECPEVQQRVADESFQARLRALRADELVNYEAVAKTKMEILEPLYQYFRQSHLQAASERGKAFQDFLTEQGEALRLHALHEALQAWLYDQDSAVWGWPVWPEAFRDPKSEAVAIFADDYAERVAFYQYLQWQAQLQLQAAGRRARELELGVGLYQDLAVSVDVGGAEAWCQQNLFALEARIGSPPDDFNLMGQDWGLPPWCPERLHEQAYAPFIAMLRHNMRAAGALRIDHVMALLRLFWVPAGKSPVEGGYVSYPFQDLLGILALESQHNRCLVIGEDLGTVPDALREALGEAGVLCYRLLYFEKADDKSFKRPENLTPQALVAVTTHDLPTLAGYWQGRDLELREQLGLFPSDALREQQVIARSEDRVRLLMALEREDLLPVGINVQSVTTPDMSSPLVEAIYRYLARSPAQALVVQLEDILGQVEQINLPGTTDQHPNWCRKLSLDLDLWAEDPRMQSFVSALRTERGRLIQQAHPPGDLQVQASIPSSTYRVQFQREFGFRQGVEIMPYLARLGISHCYASPCQQARPGSCHGYDIIDHTELNSELGGDAGFDSLTATLQQQEMGLILDMVPNHMGVMGADNAWWLDVLENGPASIYADYFDINWVSFKVALRGKVLLPVLGDHYGSVLERGELVLVFDAAAGHFCVRYYEHEFRIDPRQYPQILTYQIHRLEQRLGGEDARFLEFQSLITALGNLPVRSDAHDASVAKRARDKEVHKANLSRLYRDADIALFLDENLQTFNSTSGVELLHELLEHQAWRLAYWRVASDEINYRRFFDINHLAGLRMQNPAVFESTHGRILELIKQGQVQGLRIDHPDGLYDPAAYFQYLQRRSVAAQGISSAPGSDAAPADPEADVGGQHKPLYLLVEKILASHEKLRQNWAIHGSTGYDFTNQLNGLFVDANAKDSMSRIYHEFTGKDNCLDELVYQSKKLIMRTALASELNVLAQQLSEIAEQDRHTRDFTLSSLRAALNEIVAWFPVYRTYIEFAGVSEEDRRYVEWAVAVAKKRSHAADTSVFDFVREVLLLEVVEGKQKTYRQGVIAFAMKFQQYTGPVMAKGLEDTAFYRYNRLLSLNEVGGEPEHFGLSVAAFHHQNLERVQRWPHAMLSSSTHDSKRSEDVRARINVLSELTDEWQAHVRSWRHLNDSKKRVIDSLPAPSSNDEYFLYQTLVGAWPLDELDEAGLCAFRKRIKAYMLKAVKEAKEQTSWVNSCTEYEDAMVGFVEAILCGGEHNPFLIDFLAFLPPLQRTGLCNSLAQTLLKLTAPGVPDIYQGQELWDFSLVDPDNRRPVDYSKRQAVLDALSSALASGDPLCAFSGELMQTLSDGRAKLYLIWRCLQVRRALPELFRDGDYQPLSVAGAHAEHVCAFARCQGEHIVVTVVPRLIWGLAGGADPLGDAIWGDTSVELPAGSWNNCLTGELHALKPVERLSVGHVLRHFPVALLLNKEGVI